MAEKAEGGVALSNRAQEILGLDLRSLALFRVMVAILLLAEIVSRLFDVRAFYTDDGIVPRSILGPDSAISLHLLDGSLTWQLILFAVQAVFAAMLLVGWQTRLATLGSWFLLISLLARNPAVHYNGDTFLKMVLFFGMFLPLGAVWSIDARFRPRPKDVGPLFVSAGTIAYIVQICIVYIFAVLWKSAPEWRSEFTAVYYALNNEALATPVAKFLRQFPDVMWLFTILTMIVEAIAPLLVLFPFGTQWTRLAAVVIYIGMHASFGACLAIGYFAPVCWVGWLAMLPPVFWGLLARWCQRPQRAKLTLFTRHTPDTGSRLESLRQWLLLPQMNLVYSVPAEKGPTVSAGWWLEADTGEVLQGGQALRRLLWWSPVWWPLASVPPSVLGGVARWCGQPVPPFPDLPAYREQFVRPYRTPVLGFVVLFCLLLTIAWNIHGVSQEKTARIFPQQWRTLTVALHLSQGWGVFAPHPSKAHGWFVVVATFEDGSQLDLIQNLPPDFERRPADIAATYGRARWKRIYMGMSTEGISYGLLPFYAEWTRKEWNRAHPERPIVVLEVYFMLSITGKDHISEPQKLHLYTLSTRSEDRRSP